MHKLLSVAVTLAIAGVLALAAVAGAADVRGTIQAFDPVAGTLTLADGTRLTIPADLQIGKDQLRPGSLVKASYDAENGRNVVKSIQVVTPH